MGTVTAIGSPGDHNGCGHVVTSSGANVSSTAITSASWTTTSRPSITFDSWDDAIKFAAVIAKQHRAVKVAKVADSWTVAWTDYYGAPATYPTYPAYPVYTPTNPYVTYTTGTGAAS